MSRIEDLAALGQAVWLDYIRRSFILSGELGALVREGVRGVTSNPSIFEKAIAASADYDDTLRDLASATSSVEEVYEALVLPDVRMAADVLKPVYSRSRGADGFVSLEVDPKIADDADRTVTEAERLFSTLARPNVMIKVPATSAGVRAFETLVSRGVNVNVTLIFSRTQYEAVAEAYVRGLEALSASGGDLACVSSVASFFVSRLDTAVDGKLEESGERALTGRIAVANARLTYRRFREIFSGACWERLSRRGARIQRLLWASTGTKNPAYSDTLYVDSLIGPDTVNTLPPATLRAFVDHGTVRRTVDADLGDAEMSLRRLEDIGLDLEAITEELQEAGIAAFAKSFETLLASIDGKRRSWAATSGSPGGRGT